MPTDPCHDQLAAAVAAMARDDSGAAEQILREILTVHMQHPVAHYLLGRVAQGRAAWPEAERHFRQALALAPDRPEILLHLVQTLRAQQRAPEALQYCRQALALAPDHPGAWLELAKSQEEAGAIEDAEASYRHILSRHADTGALANLADLLSRTGRADQSERLLRGSLNDPRLEESSRAPLEYQLALALKRQGQYEQALRLLQPAPARPQTRERLLEHADLLQHVGRNEEAAALYRQRLNEDPLDMGVHILLSELRRGTDRDWLASFDVGLSRRPDAPQLPVRKGLLLLKIGRAADARQAFQTALRIAPHDAEALQGLGKAFEALNDPDAAWAAHKAGLAAAPDNGAILENHAAFLLRQGEARLAEKLAQKALRIAPASQTALALLGMCWRASGDGREEWLNDYQDHVQVFDLEAPAGSSDMESFNRELAHYLDRLHGGAREYLTQTLRGGSQTHENIFYSGHALVDRLLPRINAALRAYVEKLKDTGDHPFAKRRRNGLRHTGSWSSRLASNGFHVNHLHNHGWISSCYYVAVPEVIKGDEGQQGWIKFGEPSSEYGLGPGLRMTPRRAIEPRPGRLVLFPSYMWHGTVPFVSPEPRITIAFDVIPA